MAGLTVPSYAYAENNPLGFIDPSGWGALNVSGPSWFRNAVDAVMPPGMRAEIAASPFDVNISMGPVPHPAASGPTFGETWPSPKYGTPDSLNVRVDAAAIADYKAGKFSFCPAHKHNVSEFIAHELGHVGGVMKWMSSTPTLPKSWWATFSARSNTNSCEAGRAYRATQGWNPYGHDESTSDCAGVP